MKHRIVSAIMIFNGMQRTIVRGRSAAMHALTGHGVRSRYPASARLRTRLAERDDALPRRLPAAKEPRP